KSGTTFVAFVVEANGGFGDESLQFIKKLIQAATRQQYVWAPSQVVHSIYRAIAVQLAIDNHRSRRRTCSGTRAAADRMITMAGGSSAGVCESVSLREECLNCLEEHPFLADPGFALVFVEVSSSPAKEQQQSQGVCAEACSFVT